MSTYVLTKHEHSQRDKKQTTSGVGGKPIKYKELKKRINPLFKK